jgi:hypothetical protein
MDKTMIAIVFTDDCPSRGQAETNPAYDAVAGGFEPDGAMAGRGVRRIECLDDDANSKALPLSPRR